MRSGSGWTTARRGFPARQIAILDFAIEVAGESHAIDEDDHAALERHGFSREDGWDIAAIAGFFATSNRLAGAGDLRPNGEFFALERSPARPSGTGSPAGRPCPATSAGLRRSATCTVPAQ